MSAPLPPLPDLLVEPAVRRALTEDLGQAGDLTTGAVVPASARLRGRIVARAPGIVAGAQAAALAFRLMDQDIALAVDRSDGTRVSAGETILHLTGPARAILSAERVALNFLGHLSGIATVTAQLVEAVAPHGARVTCTRKTTPGLRGLEKHAVRAGGGSNHRFGLDDAVLIKDNHVAVAGSIGAAITRARASVGHLVRIEVEVDTLDQLSRALPAKPDAVLLDNMTPGTLRKAVSMVNGAAVTEASGRITPDSAAAIAATGVDLISAGWITHSAPSLDVGLDVGGEGDHPMSV